MEFGVSVSKPLRRLSPASVCCLPSVYRCLERYWRPSTCLHVAGSLLPVLFGQCLRWQICLERSPCGIAKQCSGSRMLVTFMSESNIVKCWTFNGTGIETHWNRMWKKVTIKWRRSKLNFFFFKQKKHPVGLILCLESWTALSVTRSADILLRPHHLAPAVHVLYREVTKLGGILNGNLPLGYGGGRWCLCRSCFQMCTVLCCHPKGVLVSIPNVMIRGRNPFLFGYFLSC